MTRSIDLLHPGETGALAGASADAGALPAGAAPRKSSGAG